MKSVVAFWLGMLMLAGSLFPQTDVEEVYKIPALIRHYHVHQQLAGSSLTFWQFLDNHYNPAKKSLQANSSEASLPLYHHLSMGLVFVLTKRLLLPPILSQLLLRPLACWTYNNPYYFESFGSLFQPPRLG